MHRRTIANVGHAGNLAAQQTSIKDDQESLKDLEAEVKTLQEMIRVMDEERERDELRSAAYAAMKGKENAREFLGSNERLINIEVGVLAMASQPGDKGEGSSRKL
ncbi:hypothetical protein QFC20_003786 [Naganishia adeliensis]|uniref:Uncharacterized protein n=1 Tax=Naganishia adeliensis TaxID=92952 RepID=A0ACC2W7Q5_9TREE|nr:hypothetical protein QFC20_003786 [Naganishia adeliensis]